MTQGSPFDPSWFNACIVFGSSPMIMMCCPTWNSLPLPIACDLFGTHLPLSIYEIPTLCTLGVRPAVVSLMKTGERPGQCSRAHHGRLQERPEDRSTHWCRPAEPGTRRWAKLDSRARLRFA